MENSRQVRPKVEKGPRPALSFTARRSGKPPLHLADLDMAARKATAQDFGYPAFRASQLSTHYFQHACVEAEKMPDLPAGQRAEMVQKFFLRYCALCALCKQMQGKRKKLSGNFLTEQ